MNLLADLSVGRHTKREAPVALQRGLPGDAQNSARENMVLPVLFAMEEYHV